MMDAGLMLMPRAALLVGKSFVLPAAQPQLPLLQKRKVLTSHLVLPDMEAIRALGWDRHFHVDIHGPPS